MKLYQIPAALLLTNSLAEEAKPCRCEDPNNKGVVAGNPVNETNWATDCVQDPFKDRNVQSQAVNF